jgi:hypothetical protein
MGIEEKKLLVIQEVISNNDEAFIDQILEVVNSISADEKVALSYKIPLRVLEDMAASAEAHLKSGKLTTTADLLKKIENW